MVYSCNGKLSEIIVEPIEKLLPDPFGPKNLGIDKDWPAQRKALAAVVAQLLSDIT
jgi:hypothetical protein